MENIFAKLAFIVLKTLVNYKGDLYDYDKKTIEENPGTPFVYGYRPTGTDLILLLPSLPEYEWKKPISIERQREAMNEMFLSIEYIGRNKHFLYYDGKRLHKKTLPELKAIYTSHADKIYQREKAKEPTPQIF